MKEKQAISCLGNGKLKGVRNPAQLGASLQTSIAVAWDTKTIKFRNHPEDLSSSHEQDRLWDQETWVKIQVLHLPVIT